MRYLHTLDPDDFREMEEQRKRDDEDMETEKQLILYTMDEIRLLGKEDIDVRVAQTLAGGNKVRVSLLLYKDARVDMKILDELFTPMGWKRTHKLIGDRLYCQVEVWDAEKKEWICKEDVGVESNTEAEKGQASDSFKRACVNWGIGRELYTAPRIIVELNENEYTKDQNNRIKVWATFSVKSIGYDSKTRTITSLVIQDRFGKDRFVMGQESKPAAATEPSKAVQARRVAAGRATQGQTYTPMDEDTYWRIIEAYAHGRPTKTGGEDYRETWIQMTHAGAEQVAKFDNDVADYRAAQM